MQDIKIGQQFSRWTVTGRPYSDHNYILQVMARCKCGVQRRVPVRHLLIGHSKSCGCFRREQLTTHGQCRTPLYKAWDAMFQRCYNPKEKAYKWYGGRGITVCDTWKDFKVFYVWAITNGYQENLTLDKIDNSKGYSPENCRWISSAQQSYNRPPGKLNASGFKGVSGRDSKWRARISVDKKSIHLGYFQTRIEAAKAYNKAAIHCHGEFAWLNPISKE